MSDSFLQISGQDEPNESNVFIHDSSEVLPGVTIETITPVTETKNSIAHYHENILLGETNSNELYYKMSEDSLDMISGQESPIGIKQSMLGYPDTDSCLSVSPSPDPDSKKKTFDFSMIDPTVDKSNLSAAMQMEQEFLDFMFSLPHIQNDAFALEIETKPTVEFSPKTSDIIAKNFAKKIPTKCVQPVSNSSRVGLDHLDNLCRMMEQLGELKEQNTRLQRRVQYLEELKTLQEMHRDMQDSIAARKSALSLGSVSLSDSDLRLEDINKSCAYLLDSEESLDQSVSLAKSKDQMLELPDLSATYQRHSSSEDDRRVKDDTRRSSDKEKKGHKSAWGKVKHMISYNSKRENVRKKSTAGVETPQKASPMLTKSQSASSTKACGQDVTSAGAAAELTGISDTEEYDLEYESMDPDGTSWEWERDCEAGIWMGPKSNDTTTNIDPCLLNVGDNNCLGVKRNKPQLTITVPSNENLHNVPRNDNSRLSAELKSSPGSSSPSKFELKSSPDFSTTPPSPRRSSNWSKVKHAFLTGPGQNQQPQSPQIHENEILPNRQQQQTQQQRLYRHQNANTLSSPPSPNKKKQLLSNFSFDVGSIQGPDESDSPSGISPEISPDDILLPTHHRQSKGRRRGGPDARHGSLPSSVVHKNLIDLQRTLTGEFNKKLQEWERLKSHQLYGGGGVEAGRSVEIHKTSLQQNAGENLPQEFRKKLHEWEKMKGREKEKLSRASDARVHANVPLLQLYHNQHHQITQDDLKTKIHDEDDLPPDFKKKLTEWEIRKALVGKGRQNVEQLQKNLGEEFNKKMAEWERMKALSQGKMSSQGIPDSTVPTTTENSSENLLSQVEAPVSPLGDIRLTERTSTDEGSIILRESIPTSSRHSHMASTATTFVPENLDRKGSGQKIKKSKTGKAEKAPLAKSEGQKHRDKELLWLEKELHKIDREKQRLEREKEKFLEREARLEKMRHAMRQGPAEKKEIYIKTSTGEFRFEGISQTFTKKLYEWEERRGIRPESSTFVLLDPNYKAPEKEIDNEMKNHSPETMKIIRSRSESSLAERGQTGGMTSIVSHQSSISLNDMEKEDNSAIQPENKSISEPTLSADDAAAVSKCAVLVQMEELVDDGEGEEERKQSNKIDLLTDRGRSITSGYQDPYAPAEITRLIDSSGSEDNLKRPPNEIDEEIAVVSTNGIIMTSPVTFVTDSSNLRRTDSQRSEESYRSLLHENMTLLGKLKEQETLCRALETQMGDIDTKMDNVADQHLKTLEKLHRQVTMMKKSESSLRMSNKAEGDSSDEAESNQRLISQLKARIVELELKGDKLMAEKEELECAFKLHKTHETQIAESLLLRIRELQDAGAEVNIQTVQCQTEDSIRAAESDEALIEHQKFVKPKKEVNIPSTITSITSTTQTPSLSAPSTPYAPVKKKRRKRRDEYCKSNENDESEEDNDESDDGTEKRRTDKDGKDHQKRKRKIPPKKVQKLHNLTADLLFQAKRLEGALVSKHNFSRENQERIDSAPSKLTRKRSLKGRSSLRLSKEDSKRHIQRKPPKGPNTTRTWSSIEAIVSADQETEIDRTSSWESRAAALASESQDLLAMNAELSRMAKELRKEMMSVWSFRESTSPESNSSDTREDIIKSKLGISDLNIYSVENEEQKDADEPKEENEWIEHEAREVFENIASLHPLDSERSKSPADVMDHELSDPEDKEKRCSPPPVEIDNNSQIEFVKDSEEVVTDKIIESTVESEEHFQSWWDVPFPKKRKCFSNPNRKNPANEIVEEPVIEGPEATEAAEFASVIPGSLGTRLSDLLKLEQEKVLEDQDTLNIRLSPYYNVTSPRASRASSTTSDDERKEIKNAYFFNSENEGIESANGTLNTNCSSTIKSDILSSSFEYEDKIKNKLFRETKSFDCSPNSWYNPSHHIYPPVKKTEFTPSQLDKVHKIIEETTMLMENDRSLEATRKQAKSDKDEIISNDNTRQYHFETEVKAGKKNGVQSKGVRTRRLSDTQIHYNENLENSFEVCSWKDENLYRDKYSKSATRTPSIRRNQSESDVLWLRELDTSPVVKSDISPDVFVTTHRTIFTVSDDNESAPQVIATFLQDNYDMEKSTINNDPCDQELSDSTLKDDLSLSSETSSAYNQVVDMRNKGKSNSERNRTEIRMTDKRNKSLSSIHNPKRGVESPRRSYSSTPFSSPPVSPSFLNALSSSYHHNSPPIRSKKKILEAANETSPTVKTMIDLYNKRITEKQELLINPFKPGDPFIEKRNTTISSYNGDSEIEEYDKGKILKSLSASVLQNRNQNNLNIQRSFSGTNAILYPHDFAESVSTSTKQKINPMTFVTHPINYLGNDVSMELDASTEESLETCSGSRISSPQVPVDSDKVKLRAIRIKRAREEFLLRGKAPLHTENRLSSDFEDLSDGLSSEDHFQNGRESSLPLSTTPPYSSSADIRACSEAPTKPPRTVELRHLPIKSKESFRRQSESCLLDECYVMKSSSSSGIELRSKQIQGRPPSNKENRKSSLDPNDNKRASRGIFKLFKRTRARDTKDLGTVQQLCKQSLTVDIASSKKISLVQDDQQPSTSSYNPELSLPVYTTEDRGRSSKTLPREEPHENVSSTSRSCPSSPVALRKSKTAQWLAMGKNIFKSRSPSPSKRPR